jgi:hypothetical protein
MAEAMHPRANFLSIQLPPKETRRTLTDQIRSHAKTLLGFMYANKRNLAGFPRIVTKNLNLQALKGEKPKNSP